MEMLLYEGIYFMLKVAMRISYTSIIKTLKGFWGFGVLGFWGFGDFDSQKTDL